MAGRDDSVYLAKLAEQAERYEGMLGQILKYVMDINTACRDGRKHESCGKHKSRAQR